MSNKVLGHLGQPRRASCGEDWSISLSHWSWSCLCRFKSRHLKSDIPPVKTFGNDVPQSNFLGLFNKYKLHCVWTVVYHNLNYIHLSHIHHRNTIYFYIQASHHSMTKRWSITTMCLAKPYSLRFFDLLIYFWLYQCQYTCQVLLKISTSILCFVLCRATTCREWRPTSV